MKTIKAAFEKWSDEYYLTDSFFSQSVIHSDNFPKAVEWLNDVRLWVDVYELCCLAHSIDTDIRLQVIEKLSSQYIIIKK